MDDPWSCSSAPKEGITHGLLCWPNLKVVGGGGGGGGGEGKGELEGARKMGYDAKAGWDGWRATRVLP